MSHCPGFNFSMHLCYKPTGGLLIHKTIEQHQNIQKTGVLPNYDLFFGGIASRSSSFFASCFCIDIPMKHTTNPVIITTPNRMAVEAVFGNAKVRIRNTGTSPIAITFSCISFTCIFDSFLISFLFKTVVVRRRTSYPFRERIRCRAAHLRFHSDEWGCHLLSAYE